MTFMGLEISTYLEFMTLVSFNIYDIFLYCLVFKCLYVDIWSNKSIYLSNKIKHLKWFTKYRVDTICDGRTNGQWQRVNIRRIQETACDKSKENNKTCMRLSCKAMTMCSLCACMYNMLQYEIEVIIWT